MRKCNDYIPWLIRETTAFYPSIYINGKTVNVSGMVNARISEALRMRESYGDVQKQSMFSYCRFNYTNTKLYYNLVSYWNFCTYLMRDVTPRTCNMKACTNIQYESFKVHHKIFLFPKYYIFIIYTSFSLSYEVLKLYRCFIRYVNLF